MKLSNLEAVNTLVRTKKSCLHALGQLEGFETAIDENGKDAGGTDGFDIGYNCNISQYDDGSGPSINMSGCYVGKQVASATRSILEIQINRINDELIALGVE